ncbi:MAG: phosphatase PAP2 family protein [Pseudorhodoplanes sp.]
MTRTGLLVALALAVVIGLVFGLYPELDLKIAGHYAAVGADNIAFPRRADFWLWFAKEAAMIAIWVIIAPVIVAVVLKLLFPRRPMLVSGRAVVFLVATLALGPGLVTNMLLKDHWGRPRPIDVTQFRGADAFVPWWDPRGKCPDNCSFVSGDASAAYWTLAPAALAPPAWRPLAYGAALVFGTAVGFLRVMFGGHFPSDVAFAGIFTFLVIWAVYALLYRRPETAQADAAIENALARFALGIGGLFGRGREDKRDLKRDLAP